MYTEASAPAASIDRTLTVSGDLAGPDGYAAFCGIRLVVDELRDDRGTDLLEGAEQTAPWEPGRRDVAVQLFATLRAGSSREMSLQAYVRRLLRLPGRIGLLRGHAEAWAARAVQRPTVPPEAMEDFLEPVPGVRFLMARFDRADQGTAVAFEAHIRRDLKQPPLFAGVRFLGADRDEIFRIDAPQEIETRDEYLIVVNDLRLPNETAKRVREVEVVVFDGVERVRVPFEVRGVPLAEPE